MFRKGSEARTAQIRPSTALLTFRLWGDVLPRPAGGSSVWRGTACTGANFSSPVWVFLNMCPADAAIKPFLTFKQTHREGDGVGGGEAEAMEITSQGSSVDREDIWTRGGKRCWQESKRLAQRPSPSFPPCFSSRDISQTAPFFFFFFLYGTPEKAKESSTQGRIL